MSFICGNNSEHKREKENGRNWHDWWCLTTNKRVFYGFKVRQIAPKRQIFHFSLSFSLSFFFWNWDTTNGTSTMQRLFILSIIIYYANCIPFECMFPCANDQVCEITNSFIKCTNKTITTE